MDDFKRRLEFPDITIRSRCIQKLVQAVKSKSRGEVITSSAIEIPELNLIWETCLSPTPSTTKLAIQAIVHLVINRQLDTKYAINKLISLATNINGYASVKGITKILMHQHNENSTHLYSLQYSKHPLIMLLHSNEDFLPLIFESIEDAIDENSLKGFQVMEPVICYLLCNPNKKQNGYSKISLIETLIDVVKSEPSTAFYILRCLPYFQIEGYAEVSEAADFVLHSKGAFASLETDQDNKIYISELLLLSAISLTERSLVVGFDPSRLLTMAIEISNDLIKLNILPRYHNHYLVLLGIVFKNASGKVLETCVELALILLDFKTFSPTVASFLTTSVTEILPEPSVISFAEMQNANSSLAQLLSRLEPLFLQLNQENCTSPSEESSSPTGEGPSHATDTKLARILKNFLCF